MFGKNPIRKQELQSDYRLWIQEIFPTIQGEGPLTGTPSIFIRLSGCNLACKFCDTEFESGTWMTTQDVIDCAIRFVPDHWKNQRPLFVLTGGEPFRQDIRPLVDGLAEVGRVQIETAGTLWLEGLNSQALIIVSPKTGKLNLNIQLLAAAYKYIITAGQIDEEDGLPNTIPTTGVSGKVSRPPPHFSNVFVQPCDEHDETKNKANEAEAIRSAMRFGYRMSLQLHKKLGLP